MDLGSAREDLWSSGTVTAARTVFASSEQEFTHLDSQLVLLLAPAAAPRAALLCLTTPAAPPRAALLCLTTPAAPEATALLPTNGATTLPTLEGAATAPLLPNNALTPILVGAATTPLLPSKAITPAFEGAATAGEGTGEGKGRREGTCVGAVDTSAGRTDLRDDAPVMISLQGSHFVACKNGSSVAGFSPDDIDGDADSEDTPAMPGPEPTPDASTDSNPTASDGGSSAFVEPDGETNSE